MRSLKLVAFTLFVLSASCTKRGTYQFEVINQTDFLIHSFVIEGGENSIQLSLNTMDTSEVVILEYEQMYFTHAPIIFVYIEEYADSVETYVCNTGQIKSAFDLSDDDINRIFIKLGETARDAELVFDYIFE